MNKVWILAIGTVLITYNYDKVNGMYYKIPKFYKGKEVRVSSTRDWPPSIVIPSITKDDGSVEVLDKRVVYPDLNFETDRDRRGRATSPTNWASAFQRLKGTARNMDNFVAFPGVNVQTDQLRHSILTALKQILDQVLSALWAGGRKPFTTEIREHEYGPKILYLFPPKEYFVKNTVGLGHTKEAE